MRFNRVGKKNAPQFRIVVQEKTMAPGGRHVEIVGSWNPHKKQGVFKNDRIAYWRNNGVQLSDSVHNLLVSKSVIEAEKRSLKIMPVKKEEGSVAEAV